MKKRIILIGFAAILAITASSQNSVVLEITHKLNSKDFDFDSENTSPENETFEVHRLEYYLSSFSVTHDGGIVTDFDSVWNLVQTGSSSSTVMLGDKSINQVESISFSVGVEQAFNHLDPTQYPTSHPLGPKSPSMHWGWTSGYRFVAMEGEETDGSEQFEIHALGDQNYFETTVDVEVQAENGNVIIPIYANYAEALRGIELKNGVITHGDFDEAIDLLENFRDHVFTATEPVDSLPDDSTTSVGFVLDYSAFQIAPNPSVGSIRIQLDDVSMAGSEISVYDLTGKMIQTKVQNTSKQVIEFENMRPGVYLVEMHNEQGATWVVRKAIVSQ
jgi:hypothetical protein